MSTVVREGGRGMGSGLLGTLLLVAACSSSSPAAGGGVQLAADQVLNIPVIGDPVSLDPASGPPLALPYADSVVSNLFGGLYRFDQSGHIQPDIATSLPTVSSDQRTYTFHLRSDAAFWNGDPVTANDFIYSWSRAVAISHNIPLSGLSVIQGATDVGAVKAATLSGLSAPDGHTLVAMLVRPAGYWPATLANDETYVVDQRVLAAKGEADWWKTPDGLVGTGPFKMQGWQPGHSLDLLPVDHWWRGSTGRLKRVHLQIVPRVQDAEPAYAHGDFGLVALGSDLYDSATYARWRGHGQDWYVFPAGSTFSLTFNINTGPFQGVAGRDGRAAFGQAIDRVSLARQVCGDVRLCTPATGGAIARGMAGYLGDGADGNAKFDAAEARSLYNAWDPDHSKVRSLAYVYTASSSAVPDGVQARNARALQEMWERSLGVDVMLDEVVNSQTLFSRIRQGNVWLSRLGWIADYDSPQDWYEIRELGDPLYRSTEYNNLVTAADGEPFAVSESAYDQVGRLIIRDVPYAPLLYYNYVTVVQPWVLGAKGFIRIDAPWTGISIASH